MGKNVMNVIAFDPGKVTGVAVMQDDEWNHPSYIVSRTENPWTLLMAPQAKWDYVICEKFTSAGRINHDGQQTLCWIGGIQALSIFRGFMFVPQSNQKRLAYQEEAWQIVFSLAVEKKEIVYQTTKTHEISALSHLLAWKMGYEKEKKGAVSPSLR